MLRRELRFMGKAMVAKAITQVLLLSADKRSSCNRMLVLVPTTEGLQSTASPVQSEWKAYEGLNGIKK